MSQLSGPSITHSDADLRSNDEIDHDFFDNPCGNATSGGGLGSDAISKSSNTGNPTLIKKYKENEMKELRFRLNLDMTAPRPKDEDDMVTPDTCVPTPNAQFFPASQLPCRRLDFYSSAQVGSNCFGSGVQGAVSGPHSSYLMMDGGDLDDDENFAGSFFTSEEAQEQPRQKLFDLSSSSSDNDSGSEVDSEGQVLDTEDEEIVELLGKYYDYIDLGSETSDLTKVSPMSSFSGSPRPTFCPSNVLQATTDHADPVYDTQPQSTRAFGGRSTKLSLAKPLPPLIIHTLEEVPIIRPGPSIFAHGFVIPTPAEESLLMKAKAEHEQEKSISQTAFAIPTNQPRKRSLDNSDIVKIHPSSSSDTTSTNNSCLSLHSKSESNLEQHTTESSMSIPSSFELFLPTILHPQEEGIENGHHEDKKFVGGKQGKKLDRNSAASFKSNHYNLFPHGKGSIHHHRFGYHHSQPVKASATIARQRQQRRIEHENSILVRRLQNVKPSKDIVEAFRPGTSNNNSKCTF